MQDLEISAEMQVVQNAFMLKLQVVLLTFASLLHSKSAISFQHATVLLFFS